MATLALGSVQFGLDYGVTHSGGQVPDADIAEILHVAASAGIETIDTAAAYGNAEAALGRAGAGHRFRLVTKLAPAGTEGVTSAVIDRIEARFRQSLVMLGVAAVDGVLVHAVADLHSPGGANLWQRLVSWKAAGLTRRIGVSIYDEADLAGLPFHCKPDLVQLPLNVLDQRLLQSGFLEKLSVAGTAIHVRSAFLQGLLLQAPDELPRHLVHLQSDIRRWSDACRDAGVSPLAASLHFAMTAPGVESVVVGVHSAAHLREIVAASAAQRPALDWVRFAAQDARAVDPRFWPKE